MPVDTQRNMMNASSNYAIINGIIEAVKTGKVYRMHIPGAFGNIGDTLYLLDIETIPSIHGSMSLCSL